MQVSCPIQNSYTAVFGVSKNALFCVKSFYLQEMRKFLALPIEEKTTHAARMMAKLKNELVGELEEENERKILKQTKSRTVLSKPTPSTHELKTALVKGGKRKKFKHHQML